jgi:SAM-dependent methyltransferase
MNVDNSLRDENGIALIYRDAKVAKTYLQERFNFSWSRLLHQSQVAEVNRTIRRYHPERILEIAPGPARLATELRGVRRGLMIDYSEEMLALARCRLESTGLTSVWEVKHHNAFDLMSLKGQWDLLYTFRFVRHFDAKERERLYHGIYSRLKPGGLFMLDVVNRHIRSKIEGKTDRPADGALPVYDATYTLHQLKCEMSSYGFTVVSMKPVIRHFRIQSWLSYTLDHHAPSFSSRLVNLFEAFPSRNPLEWIALARKDH